MIQQGIGLGLEKEYEKYYARIILEFNEKNHINENQFFKCIEFNLLTTFQEYCIGDRK